MWVYSDSTNSVDVGSAPSASVCVSKYEAVTSSMMSESNRPIARVLAIDNIGSSASRIEEL
eukprot:scaffold27544_cov78-Skeletonema_dohrnii-CCMP3373.AAC.4